MALHADDGATLLQIWPLACLLVQQRQHDQAIQCLEAMCIMSIEGPHGDVVAQAHVLLAEICLTSICSGTKKKQDKHFIRTRQSRAERCVHAVETSLQKRPQLLDDEWKLRLLKTQLLKLDHTAVDTSVRDRRQLEVICEGIRMSSTAPESATKQEFHRYFSSKLKTCLKRMHNDAVRTKYSQTQNAIADLQDNVKFVRNSLSNHTDTSLQLWLVEVSCHLMVTSPVPNEFGDAREAISFADNFLKALSGTGQASTHLRAHHLLLSAFSLLRTGELKKLPPVLDELKAMQVANSDRSSGLLGEQFFSSIVESLRLYSTACYDPSQAMTMSMNAIQPLQASIQKYSAPPVHGNSDLTRLMLVAVLFDMLHVHCRLQAQQCRYFEMGVSLGQMVRLLESFQSELEASIFWNVYLARTHVLIAEFAVAIGRSQDGYAHVDYVQRYLLPTPQASAKYPDIFVSVWVDILQVVTYCNSIALPGFSIHKSGSNGVQVNQICPDPLLLEVAAKILQIEPLRNVLYDRSSSAELRAKIVQYDLSLAKWLWATEELALAANRTAVTHHHALEALRPSCLSILHEALERASAHVNCSETTAEIMALFGPKLIAFGKMENGEQTLKNAVRLSLHAKNILLQSRLLVEIFRFYRSRQLHQAQATTVEKYEKKVGVLQRRISQAQVESNTNDAILRKRLWVEVVGARNLESRQAIDAYCVVRVGCGRHSVGCQRSLTIPSTLHPTWEFAAEFDLPAGRHSAGDRVCIQVFNEKNFFFDMFPGNSSICSGSGSASSDATDAGNEAEGEGTDEALGSVEISLGALCSRSRAATDRWYLLKGVRSGEIRVRTIVEALGVDGSQLAHRTKREAMLERHIYSHPMRDHYGFKIPEHTAREWAHLKTYDECREERRVAEWETQFGVEFFASACKVENATVRRLARAGIPRHWRERVYMNVSGAQEKKAKASPGYYQSLVGQLPAIESPSFRQIELDIDRTFGQSGTKICTEEGRATLRRILRAYSVRNPSVGYCQGLNFIVGFLTLALREESAFWLLAVICEDLYPGYYTPTMADTQTDMLVLKDLIEDELPLLDDLTFNIGLPLELLGSQWLLCLFTTTFPSETVFRVFDCIVTEGSYFVFPAIVAHLRRLEPSLLGLRDFQAVLSAIKDAECSAFDSDDFIACALEEAERVNVQRVTALRDEHRVSVRDEMQRAARARALNSQLAVVYQIPAFSSYAANLLRFFHEEAEVSSRSDVAFLLTLLCHGLVWLAEHSRRWRK
ncbi:TPA: hypothetical protein N0F65_005905 [Lagenidium giganteum]|uniref:Uncharacterized protein n=1 Tax=Lagenidium giganteum TaxID=4803 RepID=A0AAV2Z653_9STRA|nr:TPA: hypothetical protein N0F65_005905 [Lagenidium giganteum]